ncbi:hypothetical protein [Bradyrhizobium genosp. P]|uniref:hypothetical protein n=1 Tax=Bradyrhizobium genosp. P TaxID=83641 RepID=UPI003CECCB91
MNSKLNRRRFLRVSITALLATNGVGESFFICEAGEASSWRDLKIGGGGQLIGISQSDDGISTIVNTDTAGAFRLNTMTQLWEELIGLDTMPDGFTLPSKPEQYHYGYYCYAIEVAPNNKDIAYMIYGNPGRGRSWFFRCSNLTSSTPTWVQCKEFPNVPFQDSNNESNWPSIGPKMAIDPLNADVCYVGFEAVSGVVHQPIVTFDGGMTFHIVMSIPAASPPGNASVGGWCFDRASGVTTAMIFGHAGVPRLKIIWVCSSGNDVYRSTDGGLTWATVSGPQTTDYYSMTIDRHDGTVYRVPRDYSGFYVYRFGKWSAKIDPFGAGANNSVVWVAPNPASSGKLAAVRWNGNVKWSSDWGTTFVGTSLSRKSTSGDVFWMSANSSAAHYIGVGQAMYDNVAENKLWVNDGIGQWYTTSRSGDAFYRSATAGIQQIVTNKICSPWIAGSKVVVASWDRAAFVVDDPEEYPTTYAPLQGSTNDIHMGWDVDWASAEPTRLALLDTWGTATRNNSAMSTDGGATWRQFANFPYYPKMVHAGGGIAVSDANHLVAALGNNGPLVYTKDAGASPWAEETLSRWGGRAANAAFPVTITGTRAATASDKGATMGCVVCTCASTQGLRDVDIIPNGSATTIADIGARTSRITVLNDTDFTVNDCIWKSNQSGTVFVYICTGNAFAYYLNQRMVCADRKASNTFYYANSNPTNAGGGVYRLSFPNDLFTIERMRSTPLPLSGANSKLRSVPFNGITDTTGHLFYTAGPQNSSALYFNRSGGADGRGMSGWVTVGRGPNLVGQTWDVGFGKTKPGNDYPSVFIYGYVGNGPLGVYQANSTAADWASNLITWNLIGRISDFPRKFQTDLCHCIEGDANTYGQVYVGFGACGPMYRRPS